MHFRRSTSLFALCAAASMLAMSAPAALAHDSVIGGNVVSDSPLQEFPEEITLEFSAVPRDDFNTFAVTDTKTGEVLFDAEPEIKQRELTIEVPDDVKPGPGEYQVGFQITSSDGHATRGSVPGSADGAAGDAQTAMTRMTLLLNKMKPTPRACRPPHCGRWASSVFWLSSPWSSWPVQRCAGQMTWTLNTHPF